MAYRSSTKALGTNDNVSSSKPTGLADGDTVVLVAHTTGTTPSWSSVPTGFTSRGTATVSGANNGHADSLTIWTKANVTAASEPANYSLTKGGGNLDNISLVVLAFSGRHTSTAPTFQGTNDAASATGTVSIPLTGATANTGDDAVWVGGISYTGSSTPWVTTPPSGYALAQDQTDVGAFFGGNLGVATKDNLSSGATGTLTGSAALVGAAADSFGIVLLIPQAGGGGSTTKSILLLGAG